MSRINVNGEKFDLAFGVDRVTGAFVQIFTKPAIDQDCALVAIDSYGVRLDAVQASRLDRRTNDFIVSVQKRFAQWKTNNNTGLPNIDETIVIDLANIIGGFPDITKEVYKVFD
jgi:hypothetical protein